MGTREMGTDKGTSTQRAAPQVLGQVTTTGGRRVAVHYIPRGALYGRRDVLTAEEDMIEFTDPTYATADATRGFHISRYDLDTLINHPATWPGRGLCLDGGMRHYDLDADAMASVVALVCSVVDATS